MEGEEEEKKGWEERERHLSRSPTASAPPHVVGSEMPEFAGDGWVGGNGKRCLPTVDVLMSRNPLVRRVQRQW
jgi:hypothetical protein